MNSELIKVTEAQKLLGVSKKKMASLLADKVLAYELDVLDKRVKLVRLTDVYELIEHRLRKAA